MCRKRVYGSAHWTFSISQGSNISYSFGQNQNTSFNICVRWWPKLFDWNDATNWMEIMNYALTDTMTFTILYIFGPLIVWKTVLQRWPEMAKSASSIRDGIAGSCLTGMWWAKIHSFRYNISVKIHSPIWKMGDNTFYWSIVVNWK